MYSADIIEDENRVLVQCNILKDYYIKFSAVYDTGASLTCATADVISTKLKESDFSDSECITVGGLVDSEKQNIKYYKMPIKYFYLGDIPISCFYLWITFDKRVTDCVVGMDILNRVTRLHIADSNQELFFKDTAELEDYISNKKWLEQRQL